MCGRFTATFEYSDIRVRWNLDRDLAQYTPRFNIVPEQMSPTIPVIVRQNGGNDCRLMHWG
jgi:putative SOS response-associated peptidase YedK